MADVLISFQIGFEAHSNAHGIAAGLGHVDGSLDGSAEFQLVGFDGHNLDEWHLFYQLFGHLVVEAVLLHVPPGSFNVEAGDVGTMLNALSDLFGIAFIQHNSVKSTLIKSPSL